MVPVQAGEAVCRAVERICVVCGGGGHIGCCSLYHSRALDIFLPCQPPLPPASLLLLVRLLLVKIVLVRRPVIHVGISWLYYGFAPLGHLNLTKSAKEKD